MYVCKCVHYVCMCVHFVCVDAWVRVSMCEGHSGVRVCACVCVYAL